MTVTYTAQVATANNFGIFWKLLFRWRGSIYKLIWPELILYLVLYYSIRFIYMYGLDSTQKGQFEAVSLYCQNYSDLIPLTFVLGFYVNIAMSRWWEQYRMIPWPDNLAVFVSTSIIGNDDRGRLMRRTIMRYVNLSFVMTMSMISPQVKKRFPTREHLIEAGFLTKNEESILDRLDEHYPNPKNYIPLVWAGTVVTRARKEGRIRDDFAVKTLLDTINNFRQNLGGLLGYDRISIPLVYTQVVTLAVYTFFFGTLMARQYLDTEKGYPKNTSDLYVPWFTLLQFFFYMGWLKVAETLVNPFGEDDDDFEINSMIDRDIQISYLIVDGMHLEHPDLVQDKYWEDVFPQSLPYTIASEQFKTGPHFGSTADVDVPQTHQFFVKCDDTVRRDSVEKVNIENAKPLEKLESIDEEKAKECEESDDESTLWITPGDIPRNPSILSAIWSQLAQSANAHRRLSKHSEELGSDLSVRRTPSKKSTLFHRSVSRQSSNSPLPMKKNTTETSMQTCAMFRLSLESLKETTKEEEEEINDPGLTFSITSEKSKL